MGDRDARPGRSPRSRSVRSRVRSPDAAVAVVGSPWRRVVVLVGAVAFAVGRASTTTASSAVTTRPQPAASRARAPAATADDGPDASTSTRRSRTGPTSRSTTRRATALAADLVAARTVAAKYPTVADARPRGMMQAGKFAPGRGAHFIDYANVEQRDPARRQRRPAQPGRRTSTTGSARRRASSGSCTSRCPAATAPAGFPGPNDHWHRHPNLCIKYGAGAADRGAVRARPRRHASAVRHGARPVHAEDGVDGARVGRARLGEPRRACSRTRTPTCAAPTARCTPTRSASARNLTRTGVSHR